MFPLVVINKHPWPCVINIYRSQCLATHKTYLHAIVKAAFKLFHIQHSSACRFLFILEVSFCIYSFFKWYNRMIWIVCSLLLLLQVLLEHFFAVSYYDMHSAVSWLVCITILTLTSNCTPLRNVYSRFI